jgi:Icc protein
MTAQYCVFHHRRLALATALLWALALVMTRPAAQGDRQVMNVSYAQSWYPPATVDAAPSPTASSKPLKAAAASAKRQVTIDNFSFTPRSLTVPVGATVTWINHDDVPHTVVSTKKRFASPALDTDARFSYRFTAAGTYSYYCSVHPTMTGTVVVK